MTTLQIVLAISIPVATLILNAIVNIAIRFAPDAAAARRSLKGLLLRAATWLANGVVVWSFFQEALSSEPPTRGAMAFMAIDAAVMTLVAVGFVLQKMVDLHDRHLSITEDLAKRSYGGSQGRSDQ